ncbi:hypothetical protein JCM8547_000027 [Rhodosporidiobolus lusitaniae]
MSALSSLDIPVEPLPLCSSNSKKLPASPKSATSATSFSSSRRPAAPKRGRKPSFTLEIDQPASAKKPSSTSSSAGTDSRSLRKRSKSVSYVEPTASSESTDEEDKVELKSAGGGKEGRKGKKAQGRAKKEESENQ